MSAQAITMSEFVKDFKEAKTEDERAVVILDLVKQNKLEAKEEALKEISSKELATKGDIYALKQDIANIHIEIASVHTEIAKTKNAMLWAIIAICGVWVPAIVGIITTVLLKHA